MEEAGDGDDVRAGFGGDEAGDVAGVVEATGPDGDVEGAEGVGAEAVDRGPDEGLVIEW